MGSAGIAVVDVDLERELLPRPAASYDAVLATEILEHLWNPAFFLGELLRVLRPGGSLVLSTPNLVDVRNRLRMLAGRSPQQHLFGIGTVFRMNEWVHRREYAPAETRAMLEASGFTRVQVHTRTPTLSEGGRGLSALAAAAFNLMPGLGGTTYATAVKAPDARGPQIDRAMLSPAARDLAVAGLNTLPVALFVLGIGTLLHGLVPRAASTLTYGLVAASFLLEVVGSTAGLPERLLDLSVMHHVAPAPAVDPNWGSALVLLLLALTAAAGGAGALARRDIVTA
jgi:hypothetical protein